MKITPEVLAGMIDHSELRPFATESDIRSFCEIVKRYCFAAAYVLPVNLSIARSELQNCPTKLGTGIGFPLGTSTLKTKLYEAEDAMHLGAEELDVVINIGALKSGRLSVVSEELKSLVRLIHPRPLKVIIEVCYLNPQEIVEAVNICCDVGATYVKTATGFGNRPTTLEDVKLVVEAAKGRIGVKASGGIRDLSMLLNMYRLGATRFGVSCGDKLIEELKTTYGGTVDLEVVN